MVDISQGETRCFHGWLTDATTEMVATHVKREGGQVRSKQPDNSSFRSYRAAVTVLIALMFSALANPVLSKEDMSRGEYLTNILGCGGCHTEGALLGNPTGTWLTGSRIGVAYTSENDEQTPGVLFPGNLTSDKATGLGNWSKREIIRFLRTGIDHYGEQASTVMPWPNYALLNDEDLNAVADFLMHLTPVENKIPDAIPAGSPIHESFVRIGVYLFDD